MEVVLILFKSNLPKDKVIKNFEARADLYRAVPGLVQKYYIHDDSTGHFGASIFLILRGRGGVHGLDLVKSMATHKFP